MAILHNCMRPKESAINQIKKKKTCQMIEQRAFFKKKNIIIKKRVRISLIGFLFQSSTHLT